VIAGYRERTDKKIDLSYVPSSVVQENFEKNPGDMSNLIFWAMDTGKVIVGDTNDNSVWPEWNPKKVLDMICD
jgi:hypothetical protein